MIAVRFRGKFGENPSQPSLPLSVFSDTKQALTVGIPVGLLVMMQCIIAFLDMKSAAVF